MRYVLALITVVSAIAAAQGEGARAPFPDVADSPYLTAIAYLAAEGYVGGFPDGNFRPYSGMSRAEFLTMAMRAREQELEPVDSACTPDSDAWYAHDLCLAERTGVVGDAGFRPQDDITYAEALSMLTRALELPVRPAGTDETWFAPLVLFADRNGVIPSGSYSPQGLVSREAATNLLYRSLVLVRDPANLTPFDDNAALTALVASAMFGAAEQPLVGLTAGCGMLQLPAPSSLVVGGVSRSLITHVPSDYDNSVPHKLVVAFHGRTNSNAQVRNYMDLERHAADAIIVYPAGISQGNGSYSWSDGSDPATALRDYQLFDAVVSEYSERYCIDEGRIFVTGHSLGAWFANSLACARAGVIRAAATLAGGISASTCGEVAAMIMHNPNDHLVPISDGIRARDRFLEANSLDSEAAVPLAGGFRCTAYGQGQSPNPVVWCPHDIDHPFGNYYNPHGWPQGTGKAIMEFFGQLN